MSRDFSCAAIVAVGGMHAAMQTAMNMAACIGLNMPVGIFMRRVLMLFYFFANLHIFSYRNNAILMKNLADSEILKSFQEKRHICLPYGLTCERWIPHPMGKFDRHNEIELNFMPSGSLNYLFQNRLVTIPSGRLSAFWGLIPHKIVDYDSDAPYYVATIPLSVFLSWCLPEDFVERLLDGEVLMDHSADNYTYDGILFENWASDISNPKVHDLIMIEMHGRLMRLAQNSTLCQSSLSQKGEIQKIESMAVYIARNYDKGIKVSDVGKEVGLHPDYANSLFRKAFGHSLTHHLMIERVNHAQRQLVSSKSDILSIAFGCGFNSVSSFNKAFRRLNGCTPREYRKQNRVL